MLTISRGSNDPAESKKKDKRENKKKKEQQKHHKVACLYCIFYIVLGDIKTNLYVACKFMCLYLSYISFFMLLQKSFPIFKNKPIAAFA